MSKSIIKETSFDNCKVVTFGISQELHEKVVEMVKDDPFWLMQYDLEEVDANVIKLMISDARSEGDEEYVGYLHDILVDDGTLYRLTERVGDFEQSLGEVAVYINEEGYAEKLRQDAENVIYDMFSDWDISDAGELCCNIIDEVCEDVMETSDYPEYNDSDIRLAVKRTIINLTSIGK